MKILIPKEKSPFASFIKKGSGVVMLDFSEANDLSSIYYEGNLYDAENLQSYEQRIKCAAGRAHMRYPTIAMCGILQENMQEFIEVGVCDPDNGYNILFKSGTLQAIKRWLNGI